MDGGQQLKTLHNRIMAGEQPDWKRHCFGWNEDCASFLRIEIEDFDFRLCYSSELSGAILKLTGVEVSIPLLLVEQEQVEEDDDEDPLYMYNMLQHEQLLYRALASK